MPDLEKFVAEWRKSAAKSFSAEALDELETHLREMTEQLVRSGINLSDAFERAVAELGAMREISSEFKKLEEPMWLPLKLVIGTTGLLAVLLAIFVIARMDSSRSTLLLAAHKFTAAFGYCLTLLMGGLGICFVSQRCFTDFSRSRLRTITRLSLAFGSTALFLTALGVVLGMIWTKVEWGRYWAWDSKEIGGLRVVVWLACYVIAHHVFKNTERGVLGFSMLGNIVVSLAWFNSLHLSGAPAAYLVLAIVTVGHLAFFTLGFVVPGSLRVRNGA